jgi:hypothetical protein
MDAGMQKTEVGGQRTDVGGQKPDAGIQKTEVGGKKTEHNGLRTGAVQNVAAAGQQRSNVKIHQIGVREQRAETIRHQRSGPSTPLKQTTQGEARKAGVKEQKRKVTN